MARSFCGLTTQAQRAGPRGRSIATWTRGPGSLQRMVELSRCAAGKASRLVDNPAPEVNSRLMQHSTVLCFRFRLERRLKLWLKQGGCDKSKGHFFTGGLRGRFSIIGLLGPFFALF